jgi:hypothetical protein
MSSRSTGRPEIRTPRLLRVAADLELGEILAGRQFLARDIALRLFRFSSAAVTRFVDRVLHVVDGLDDFFLEAHETVSL